MFPSAVRAALRATGAKFLTDVCVVQRETPSTDGHLGGTFADVLTAVACRMMGETQRDTRGQIVLTEGERTFWKLALGHGVDIRTGDRVVFGGEKYEVLQVYDAATDRVFVQAQLARLS